MFNNDFSFPLTIPKTVARFEQIMKTSNLPQEILIDIFSLLPAKSIGKCRCLAKIWQTLLSTPQFIKSHLTRRPHQENLILVAPSGSVHSAAACGDGAVSRTLQSPENCTQVAGSCDGLILLVNEVNGKFLVNPITQQCVRITDSPLALTVGESFSMYGLGYDEISNDYKIVALSYWDSDNGYHSDCDDIFVDVYSVKWGVWERVDCSPYDHSIPCLSSGAFVNGAIHWLASDQGQGYPFPSVIVAFDFADNVFDEIPPPSDVDVNSFVRYKLVVLGGFLCMVDSGRNRIDVWMMKEYGVAESWTKFTFEGACEFEIVKPVCFVGDEEVVFVTGWESLVVNSVKAKLFRDMVVDGVPAMFVDADVFVGSLVSPAVTVDGVQAM